MVQVAVEMPVDREYIPVPTPAGEGAALTVWIDVATVTVASRAKRRGVIEKALKDAQVKLEAGKPVRVRALNAQSSSETSVALKQPDPVLEIG